MRIGVVGTGMLGEAVALRLLVSGARVAVYNRTREKTSGISRNGGAVLDSPGEVAAESDLVLTVVRDADAMNDVSFGGDGIARGSHEGLVVADMSTIEPSRSREMTARFLRDGIRKLDAPVMGGPDAAGSGDLVMMVSGDRDALEWCRDSLRPIAREIIHVGDAGAAHSVKIAMNLQIAMLALSLSEGITLAGESGVDPRTFLSVLNSTYFATGMSRRKAFRMIDGRHDPTFTLENMRKDIGIMTGTAESLGLDLPMVRRAGEIYRDAAAGGLGGLDYTGIIAHIRRINGLDPAGNKA